MTNKSKKIKNTKKEIWEFLYKEWARLNDSIKFYDKMFSHVNINEDRYNQAFGLLLMSLTVYIIVKLDIFFQSGKRYWSLYKISGSKNKINKNRKKLEELIIKPRNNNIAHLTQNYRHENNTYLLSKKGIKEIMNILEGIDKILKEVSRKNEYNGFFLDGWGGTEDSIDILFEDLGEVGKLLKQKYKRH